MISSVCSQLGRETNPVLAITLSFNPNPHHTLNLRNLKNEFLWGRVGCHTFLRYPFSPPNHIGAFASLRYIEIRRDRSTNPPAQFLSDNSSPPPREEWCERIQFYDALSGRGNERRTSDWVVWLERSDRRLAAAAGGGGEVGCQATSDDDESCQASQPAVFIL